MHGEQKDHNRDERRRAGDDAALARIQDQVTWDAVRLLGHRRVTNAVSARSLWVRWSGV
jgi:hypothetical protein